LEAVYVRPVRSAFSPVVEQVNTPVRTNVPTESRFPFHLDRAPMRTAVARAPHTPHRAVLGVLVSRLVDTEAIDSLWHERAL
jgi:hypothetical protein